MQSGDATSIRQHNNGSYLGIKTQTKHGFGFRVMTRRPGRRSVPEIGVALYFFHLCDGEDVLIDPEGREIGDIALIPAIALKEARAIIREEVIGGSIKLAQRIEVLDQAGVVIHRLAFRDAVIIDL